jgi:hypothetical protein
MTHAARNTMPRAPGGRTAARDVQTVVVRLTAVGSCRVVFSAPRGRFLFRSHVAAGASKAWIFRRPVDLRLERPGGARLTVDGKNPLLSGPATRPVTLILCPGHPAAAAPARRGPAATVRAYVTAINGHHYAPPGALAARTPAGRTRTSSADSAAPHMTP